MESPAAGREAWVQEPHRSQPQDQSDLGPALVTSYMKRRLLKHFQSQVPSEQVSWLNKLVRIAECMSKSVLWYLECTKHHAQGPISLLQLSCLVHMLFSSLIPHLCLCHICHVWARKQLWPRHRILSLWCLGGNSDSKGTVIYRHHHCTAFQVYTYARPERSSWQLVELPSFGRFWNSIQLVPESQISSDPLITVHYQFIWVLIFQFTLCGICIRPGSL